MSDKIDQQEMQDDINAKIFHQRLIDGGGCSKHKKEVEPADDGTISPETLAMVNAITDPCEPAVEICPSYDPKDSKCMNPYIKNATIDRLQTDLAAAEEKIEKRDKIIRRLLKDTDIHTWLDCSLEFQQVIGNRTDFAEIMEKKDEPKKD